MLLAHILLISATWSRIVMLQEKLDKLYICIACKTCFLFQADTEDHDRLWGHNQFTTWPLEVNAKSFKK